jgi:tocopherol cyclase
MLLSSSSHTTTLITILLLTFIFSLVSTTTSAFFGQVSITKQRRQQQRLQLDPIVPAYPQQPPHAGCHFRPTHPGTAINHKGPRRKNRFFEGWYYRLTLQDGVSFAFIFSIEDPKDNSPLSLCCCQIMGPNDEYLLQADPDHTKFWAWQHQQGLGCTFEFINDDDEADEENAWTTMIDPDEYQSKVKTGFQMTPNRLQGKIMGHDGSLGTTVYDGGIPGSCDFDIDIVPLVGWGDHNNNNNAQKSTAGWLAKYAVFEPHWQVTLADARASGSIRWKNTTYTFTNAPFYAEKNWGGAFPTKWYWTQCNSFHLDDKPLAVTAGGGTRQIPMGQTEDLGMVSVHYDGIMYEATPWIGTMQWDVSPWGMWNMTGRSTKGERPFEVALFSTSDKPGVVLRVPSSKGMVYFCRDSFSTNTTLSLWELVWDKSLGEYVRGKTIIDEARSTQAAVEVGGGPWWDRWKGESNMKQPFKGLVRFPYRVANLRRRLMQR